jgi:LAO/AO transport system kinase
LSAPYRPPPRPAPDIDRLETGVRAGDRSLLAQAITLIESERPEHADLGQRLLQRLLPMTGGSFRVGITGLPGAGKSTLLEALGVHLADQGLPIAVLAIDPSSSRTGGSILGDKTRMARLGQHPLAYIRPTAAGRTLGGVHRRTRETLLLCEAAGYKVIFVETVGVGQSETAVASMVDSFVVLSLSGGGDQLQGIKRGVLELAEILVLNKADGANRSAAERAAADHRAALHYLQPTTPGWTTPVLLTSALESRGIPELWSTLESHRAHLRATGELDRRRATQLRQWTWALAEEELLRTFRHHPAVVETAPALLDAVARGEITAVQAALRLLAVGEMAPGRH